MNFTTLRKSKGFTQAELAKRIGRRQSAIGMWESGKSKPKLDAIPVLAKVLDCTSEEILRSFEKMGCI